MRDARASSATFALVGESSAGSRFVTVIRGGSSFAAGPSILGRRRMKSKSLQHRLPRGCARVSDEMPFPRLTASFCSVAPLPRGDARRAMQASLPCLCDEKDDSGFRGTMNFDRTFVGARIDTSGLHKLSVNCLACSCYRVVLQLRD